MLGMTQTEYARHRNVARQTIHKMVKAGKIPVGTDGRIDPAAADFALGENRSRVNEPAAPLAPSPDTGSLTRARTATEVYKARMAQLLYEERLGRSLSLDGVIEATKIFAETVQRSVRRISTHAEEVHSAACRDGQVGTRNVLKKIEYDVLANVSAACIQLATAATNARFGNTASEEFDSDEVEGAEG
jgi:hypothetical protein